MARANARSRSSGSGIESESSYYENGSRPFGPTITSTDRDEGFEDQRPGTSSLVGLIQRRYFVLTPCGRKQLQHRDTQMAYTGDGWSWLHLAGDLDGWQQVIG